MLSEREQIFLDRAYDKYARYLLQYSLSMLRFMPDAFPLAEECVQETFEVAIRKIRILQHYESPQAWLIATCKRITMAKRRKTLNRLRITGKAVPIDETGHLADVHNRIDEWIEQHDHQQKRQKLIQSLSEQELAVFRAYYEEELTLKESAERLGLSETAVHGSVQKIRAKAARISLIYMAFLWFVSGS